MAHTVSKNTYLPPASGIPPYQGGTKGGSKLGEVWNAPLLPIEAVPDGAVNLEVVQYSDCQPTLDEQNLVSLGADVELPDLCDLKDVTITVLEGKGSLALNQEAVVLEPELFVFIPAQTLYTLRSHTDLILLLSRYEPDRAASESAWVINL